MEQIVSTLLNKTRYNPLVFKTSGKALSPLPTRYNPEVCKRTPFSLALLCRKFRLLKKKFLPLNPLQFFLSKPECASFCLLSSLTLNFLKSVFS